MLDAKSALEAVEAIRNAVPVNEQAEFDTGLVDRFNLVGETAGTVAVADTVDRPETELEKQLPDFLNPDKKIDMVEQLGTMRGFYAELGMAMPDLNEEQSEKLSAAVEAHPERRVVPTPLLDLAGRKKLAEAAKETFSKANFNENYEALWAPDSSWSYGQLLENPEATVKDGNKSYGLRYKTAHGEPVSREAYIKGLVDQGKAVIAEDGTVWIYPVMDVQVKASRQYAYVRDLHAQVDTTNTPEALITMQLLHQASGTPNPNWEPDFANEAVYELDKKGNPKQPVYVASVVWVPYYARLDLRSWGADFRDDYCGVRAEESGL